MELKINILANGNILTVEDFSDYLPEDGGVSPIRFKKSDVESLILLESHKSTDEEGTVNKYTFGKSISIDSDGWYTVHYLIIPNKQWFEKNKFDYDVIYYTHDGKIYNIKDNYIVEDLREIIDNNHYSPNINTNIFCTFKEYVSIANLYECYINFCQLLLSNRGGFSKCFNKNSIDSELVYKRDLVWMAINVIDYLVDRHSKNNPTLGEALRIIELIHSCTGICQELITNNRNTYGCGCSKR